MCSLWLSTNFRESFLSAPHHNVHFLCQILFPWPVNDKFLLILPQWWDFHSHSRLRERFSFPFPHRKKRRKFFIEKMRHREIYFYHTKSDVVRITSFKTKRRIDTRSFTFPSAWVFFHPFPYSLSEQWKSELKLNSHFSHFLRSISPRSSPQWH